MSRPPIEDRSQVQSHVTRIRSTAEQRKRWEQAAQQHGETLSQWLRRIADRAARTGM